MFDSKKGCWPLIACGKAIHKSKYRESGDDIIKPITKVNNCVIKKLLIEGIIPRIKKVWPKAMKKQVTLQWDNATPHKKAFDIDVLEACTSGGWDIDIVQQSAKSPDLNTLDLGYFNALQTLQYIKVAKI